MPPWTTTVGSSAAYDRAEPRLVHRQASRPVGRGASRGHRGRPVEPRRNRWRAAAGACGARRAAIRDVSGVGNDGSRGGGGGHSGGRGLVRRRRARLSSPARWRVRRWWPRFLEPTCRPKAVSCRSWCWVSMRPFVRAAPAAGLAGGREGIVVPMAASRFRRVGARAPRRDSAGSRRDARGARPRAGRSDGAPGARRRESARTTFEEILVRGDRPVELTALDLLRELVSQTSGSGAALWIQDGQEIAASPPWGLQTPLRRRVDDRTVDRHAPGSVVHAWSESPRPARAAHRKRRAVRRGRAARR